MPDNYAENNHALPVLIFFLTKSRLYNNMLFLHDQPKLSKDYYILVFTVSQGTMGGNSVPFLVFECGVCFLGTCHLLVSYQEKSSKPSLKLDAYHLCHLSVVWIEYVAPLNQTILE